VHKVGIEECLDISNLSSPTPVRTGNHKCFRRQVLHNSRSLSESQYLSIKDLP